MPRTVEETIEDYVNAWNSMDFAALEHAWDKNAEEIHYVAEEMERPFTQLAAVRDYWRLTAEVVERVWMNVTHQRSNYLTDDICVVTYSMHMDAELRPNAGHAVAPIGVDVRVSAILMFADDNWKFIHYVESPLGPLPFMRKAYQKNYRR